MDRNTLPTIFVCKAVAIDTEENTGMPVEAKMVSFLCPHCSNTHFEVVIEDTMKFAVTLTPDQAEKIGKELICPRPAQYKQLGEAKLD